jgi:hypothetical protein
MSVSDLSMVRGGILSIGPNQFVFGRSNRRLHHEVSGLFSL